jgi:hypothetical protein
MQSKHIAKQAITVALSHEPLRREPMLRAERILTVDLAATQAQAKGVAPSTSHEVGQTVAAVATPLNALPPPFADGVDRLYHQLVECAHWHRSDSTSSPVHARAGWQKPIVEPSWQGWHHHRPDSRPKAHHGSGASASHPKLAVRLARGTWGCHPEPMHRAHAKMHTATRRNTVMILRDQDQTGSHHNLSRHRMTFSSTHQGPTHP